MEQLSESIYHLSEPDRDEAILSLLSAAKEFSRPVISGFAVGAVCLGGSRRAYLGANMEFRGLALNFTVHAEQAAVVNAWLHGESHISLLAVSAAPCGLCRQFLMELCCRDDLGILMPQGSSVPLKSLLPEGFLLDQQGGGQLLAPSPLWPFPSSGNQSALAQSALRAARLSYAPYTHSPSGAALLCRSGRIFAGGVIENGAYNPGLLPVQTALIHRNLSGAQDDPIVSALLVEAERAPVSQWSVFQTLLQTIDPEVQLARMSITDEKM